MTDVEGRTAFITGGGNGIGLGIARSFARVGVKLALADVDAAALERARAELESQTQVVTVVLDVRDRDAYAVVGMSETLQPELARAGIGVSVLCPGPVATDIVARTAENQPDAGEHLTDVQRNRRDEITALMTQFLKQGVHPDEVGEMVLEAVRADRLYIHTDRIMAPAIEARTKALLDAMPGV